MLRKALAWGERNERHLGALVFIFGFVTDIVALALLDASIVLALFTSHLALAGLAIFLGHALHPWRSAKQVSKRSVMVMLPLIAQYLLGGLLSWFLIFYAKSASLEASWPFIVLLALVFIGNEWFRKYKDRLAFIAVLYFFALYAYAVFTLPLLLGFIGPRVFLASTALALAAFGAYLAALFVSGRARLRESLQTILLAVLVITVLMTGSYFGGLIPPLPLALAGSGIYHEVRREGQDYVLLGEDVNPWWDPRPDLIRIPDGAPLYAFSAVSAPTDFGAVIVHRWQRYDRETRSWVTQSRIAFPIAGGRADGYRGYSTVSAPSPGDYRVRVETESGQVIGSMRFTVERVPAEPPLVEERR